MIAAGESHALEFDPARHAYLLDGRPVPGVTTITGMLDAPGLDAWRARVGWAEAQRIATTAAEMGTAIHAAAAAIVRGIPLLPLDIGERFAPAVEMLGNWLADNVEEALFVEETMGSPRLRFAGRLDLAATLRGRKRPLIVDYKSGNGVYLGSVLQQSGYRILAREWVGMTCDRLIIHMPPPRDGEAQRLTEIPLRRHTADESAFHALVVLWRRSQEESY